MISLIMKKILHIFNQLHADHRKKQKGLELVTMLQKLTNQELIQQKKYLLKIIKAINKLKKN